MLFKTHAIQIATGFRSNAFFFLRHLSHFSSFLLFIIHKYLRHTFKKRKHHLTENFDIRHRHHLFDINIE